MNVQELIEQSEPFLGWLLEWQAGRKTLSLEEVGTAPEKVAVIAEDMVEGFCRVGPLSSPRVERIIAPIVQLFQTAHRAGVRHFLLIQDSHDADAVEFGSYPPHCVQGSQEAETVHELLELPFSGDYVTISKNSVSPAIGTDLDRWLDAHPEVETFIVTGDCTDICVYQMAMHLRMRANVYNLSQRVIVPADCVATYDLPVDVARSVGATPHDGDLLHLIFLYHMALNGVEVVAGIAGVPEVARASSRPLGVETEVVAGIAGGSGE
jgi:nicotinamidase-related amidase